MSANKLVEPHWLEEHLDDPKIRILEFNWNATDCLLYTSDAADE